MNLPKIYLIAILVLAFCLGANSQEPPKAVLVDEFANLFCSDELRARLDNFFSTISEAPGSVGYIVANADTSMPGRFHKYFRMFQNHVRFRRFFPDRVSYFRGPDKDALHFQFWLVPKGAPQPDIPLEFRQEQVGRLVLFDASEISSVKKGVVEFGGDFGNEPCDFGLDLNQFAINLGANPSLNGYLVASSNGRRDSVRTKMALNLTAAELIKQHRVPAHRIKTLYVGDRKSQVMQLWLVPKGALPPSFRENSVP